MKLTKINFVPNLNKIFFLNHKILINFFIKILYETKDLLVFIFKFQKYIHKPKLFIEKFSSILNDYENMWSVHFMK